MELRRFIAELKGRGVYRVTALYSAGAWVILQVADVLVPALGMPEWSITVLLTLAVIGFPITLVLTWLFDLTPEGIVDASTIAPSAEEVRWSRTHIIEFTLIVLLALLVGYLYLERLTYQQASEAAALEEQPQRASIAVMPFVNMSGEEDMEYLGDGLAEEILNLLAKLNELNVAARTSSFHFKNRNMDIQIIGEQLGVSHVLEGSVRYEGARVRVTAQLINAGDGFHLWSETYDRELEDMLALQSEIAGKVVDNLQVLLSADSRDTLSRSSLVDPVAYDYYLRAREYLRMPRDEANLEFAADLFGEAVDRNPAFADAYAGLCDALLGLYSIDRDQDHFESAEAACHRALTLDRRAATVYIALGNLYRSAGQYDYAVAEFELALALNGGSPDAHLGLADTHLEQGEMALAERNYQLAIQLQPQYWRALMGMAGFLFTTGRVEEAIPFYQRVSEFMPDSESALNNMGAAYFLTGDFERASLAWQKSLQLEPSAKAYSNVATSLFFLGRFDESLPLYHKAVELAPENYELWGNLGDAYRHCSGTAGEIEMAGPMYLNAIRLAKNRLEINTSDADTLALVGHYYAGLGERETALEYIGRATALAPDNMYVSYSAATALAALGEMDRAMTALERALQSGYPLHMALADANLQAMRNLPRFEALNQRRE